MNHEIKSERPRFKTRALHSGLKLSIALPGVTKDSVQVNLEKRLLSINGERKPLEGEFQNADREACHYQLKIELHEDLDTESITATHSDGILTLQLNKRKELAPRKIDILAN